MFKTWSSALAAAAVGSAAAASVQAAVQPAAAATPAKDAAEVPESVLRPSYNNVPADTILNDIAREFGLVILKDEPLDVRVSVRMPERADIGHAVAALKESLIPRGFTLQPGDAVGRIWKVTRATRQDELALAAAKRVGEPATLKPRSNTMKSQFVDTPIDAILDEMAATLGIEIDRAAPVPGRITVNVPNPVNAEEAMHLLNALLAPFGYTSMELERYAADGTPRLAVRVWSIEDAKKGAVPVQ
jgi:hypothetical protein